MLKARRELEIKIYLPRVVTTVLLTMVSSAISFAQKPEFSANMRLIKGAGQTETVKLHVGNQRARLDRIDSAGESGIGALIIDFDHQLMYLLMPQSKVYLRIAGSSGTPFYQAAWMFRPHSSDAP